MKLYCADCMDILKGIPEGSIDMILCDLPYGTTRNKWDVIIPLEPLWAQYRRLTFSPQLKQGDSCINHHCAATEVVASYTMSDRRYFPCVPTNFW